MTWDQLKRLAEAAGCALVLFWWLRHMFRLLEWQDRARQLATARRQRLAWHRWLGIKLGARLRTPIVVMALLGVAGIVAAAYLVPATVALAGSAGLSVVAVKRVRPSPSVSQLESAVTQRVGSNDAGQQPIVQANGHGPEGPKSLRIKPPAETDWPHWTDRARDDMAALVNATLPADYAATEWKPDGSSTWTRLPKLPALVPYPGPNAPQFAGLAWHEVPVGVDGDGNVAVLDLNVDPHALIAGSTRTGKTSYLRCVAVWLLHHRIPVTGMDIQGIGLAFLEQRPGVELALDFPAIVAQVAAEKARVEAREAKRRQGQSPAKARVLILDELDRLSARAHEAQRKRPGITEPPLITDLHDIMNTAGKVNMHVILASQDPGSDTIPRSMRDQAKLRIAVGPMSDAAARICLGDDAALARATPAVKGRAVRRVGDTLGHIQGYWLPDPDDPKHPDRHLAEAMLPERDEPPDQAPPALPAIA